jgi:nitroreductase
MDIYEALYTTRSMRRLTDKPIPLDVQERIMDAAVRAPSGSNRQPWRFLLVDDADLRARLGALYLDGWHQLNLARYGTATPEFDSVRRSADRLAHHFADVPLLLLAFGQGPSESSVYPALWSAMLAARAEGVGTTLTTVLGYHRDEVFELLGVPADEDWRMYGCVTMGYPTGRWGVATRRPLAEVTARNRWDHASGFTSNDPLWSGDAGS